MIKKNYSEAPEKTNTIATQYPMFEIQEFYTDNFYPDLDLGNLFKVTAHHLPMNPLWVTLEPE